MLGASLGFRPKEIAIFWYKRALLIIYIAQRVSFNVLVGKFYE